MSMEEIQQAAQRLQSIIPPGGVPLINGNGTGVSLTQSEIVAATATIKRLMSAEIKRFATAKPGSVEEQTLAKSNGLVDLMNKSNVMAMIAQAIARGQF